jgi:Tol biopolymer transport system component
MMKPATLRAVLHLCILGTMIGVPASAAKPKGSLTIDRIAEIKYPTAQAWSPDNRTIAFLWDAAGKQDIYTVQTGSPPIALTDFAVNPDTLRSDIAAFAWASADQVIFVRDGSLWTVSTATRKPTRMPGFEGVSDFCLLHDHKQILYSQKGQVWVNTLDAKTGRQLTHLTGDMRVSGLTISQDDLHLSFSASLSEDIAAPAPFNGDRVRVYRNTAISGYTALLSIYGGEVTVLQGTGGGSGRGGGGIGGVQWATSPAGPQALLQVFSADRKTREIKVYALSGESHTIWKDFDPAWWSPSNSPRTVVSPDGRWVAFICDRTGWPLVYALPTDASSESQAKQLSFGKKIEGFPSWSADSKRVAYSNSNDGDAMSRYISIADDTHRG